MPELEVPASVAEPSSPDGANPPAATPTEETSVAADKGTESPTVGPATDPTAEDDAAHLAWLANHPDLDGLFKRNSRLQGKAGEIADKLATKKAEKMVADERQREVEAQRKAFEAEERQLQQEIDNLVDDDPEAALEKTRQLRDRRSQRQSSRSQAELVQQEQSSQVQYTTGLLHDLFFEQPREVQEALAGKTFNGNNPAEALRAYHRAIVSTRAEYDVKQGISAEVTKAKEGWEKDLNSNRIPALERDILARVNGTMLSPDVGGGHPPAADYMDQGEWDRIKSDIDVVRKPETLRRVNEGLRLGYIRK
jgi:hypothetical protein